MEPAEWLLAKNYWSMEYHEGAVRWTLVFVVGVLISSLMMNHLMKRPPKKPKKTTDGD
jgi:hypothetical protein